MNSRTKLGLVVLGALFLVVILLRLLNISKNPLVFSNFKLDFSQTFSFEFRSRGLSTVVQKDLQNQIGSFAVFIEDLKSGEKYGMNEVATFPAASLYKLILMAAILKEIETGNLGLEDNITGRKSHLIEVLGEEDFGYEGVQEYITYSVEEALQRVGRISDNFAAIMLTEKLSNKLLIQMAKDLGMGNTSFDSDLINTTALDIATYFKKLYSGQIVSPQVSQQIIDFLLLSNLNDRIPAKLPNDLKIVHKTGEISRVRHDAGIVYLESNAYVIVLLSKDLKYEDEGVETLAQISQDVYIYFKNKDNK